MVLRSLARQARFQFWKLDSLRFAGSAFSCPICGGKFGEMKPFVGSWSLRGVITDHYTPNAICPRCHSDIRQRFVVEYLRQKSDLLTMPHRVLHFAPEISIYNLFRQSGADYVAADIDPSQFVGAVFADITDIPFPAEDFDATICIHVLEHIADDQRAIGELHRILKPGGQALIAVPTYGDKTYEDPNLDYDGRVIQYGIGDHLRMNGLDFSDKLRDAGFLVDVVSIDDVEGDFFDRSVRSPHTESDRYLFHCVK